MKDFLLGKAKKDSRVIERYQQDIEPRYREYLKHDVSWIYKVSVLALIDANKCDFVTVHFGLQRHENAQLVYLGYLDFPDGENMDIGRVLVRLMDCLVAADPIFSAEI